MVADGVMEGVAVYGDVAVGGMVGGGVKVKDGATANKLDKVCFAVSLFASNISAFFSREST